MKINHGADRWLSFMKARQSRRFSLMKRRESQLLAEGEREYSSKIKNVNFGGWDTRYDTIGGFLVVSF